MSPTRRDRGHATERLVADYLRQHGWPHATITRGHGTDITNTPALAWEIKARRAFSPLAWLRQAHTHGDADHHIAIIRPDGMGPASIGSWAMMLTLDDGIALLHAAGYGTPPTVTVSDDSGTLRP